MGQGSGKGETRWMHEFELQASPLRVRSRDLANLAAQSGAERGRGSP